MKNAFSYKRELTVFEGQEYINQHTYCRKGEHALAGKIKFQIGRSHNFVTRDPERRDQIRYFCSSLTVIRLVLQEFGNNLSDDPMTRKICHNLKLFSCICHLQDLSCIQSRKFVRLVLLASEVTP